MTTDRPGRRLLAALASAAVAGAGAGGAVAFAAGPAQPSTVYSGFIKFPEQRMRISLTTDSTAKKVTVVPGYWRNARKCNKNARGELFSTDLFNKRQLTIAGDGSFRGAGSSGGPIASDDPRVMVARWTVRGRFTSATTASGTLRIGMKLRSRGRTVINCKPITVKWSTARVRLEDSERGGGQPPA